MLEGVSLVLPSIVIAGVFSHRCGGCSPGPNDEFVTILNVGAAPVSLVGWSLTNVKADQIHRYRYHFPRRLEEGRRWQLAPGELVIVHTGRGISRRLGDGQYHFYQQRQLWIWDEDGDTICLCNDAGGIVNSFRISSDAAFTS